MRIDVRAAQLFATLALASAVGAGGASAAYVSPAPDVVVYTEPALTRAVTDIGVAYRAKTGNPVRVFEAPSSLLLREIPHVRDDVMILQGTAIANTAISERTAAPAPLVRLGRNHLVIARRGAGLPLPVASLDPAAAVAIVDAPVPDQLGALSHAALAGAGWPGEGAQIQGVARGADAAFLLDEGKVAFAVLYRTDVAAEAAFSVAATLPDPAIPIDYVALASSKPDSRNTADFLAYLGGPEAKRILMQDGLTETTP